MKPLLVNFGLGHMANDWAPAAIWLLVPAIATSLNLSPTEIGLLIAIHTIGASLGYLPAGILSDRIHHKGRLLAATFWWVAAGYFLASLAPGFWSLAIILAIAGMGDAAWHPIATGILVEQRPKQKGLVLGIHAMGGSFAEVGSPLAIGFLQTFVDWRSALQLAVIPAMIMGIVFIFFAREIPPSNLSVISRVELGAIARHWFKPAGLILIGMISIYNMALMALLSMIALFLQNDLAYSPAQAGIAFACSMLIGSLAQPFIGRYSDTSNRHGIFIVGSALAIVCSAIAAAGNHPGLIVAALVANIAILASIRSGVLAAAVEYASSRAATTLGFVFVVLDGVGALGAILAGLVGEHNLQNVFALAGILTLLSVILSVILYRKNKTYYP
jgi:FSR family fosmidomycin resistance protein-like MFS transporter